MYVKFCNAISCSFRVKFKLQAVETEKPKETKNQETSAAGPRAQPKHAAGSAEGLVASDETAMCSAAQHTLQLNYQI